MRQAHRGGPAGGHANGPPLHLLRVEALKAAHLSRRFFGSLRRAGPAAGDVAWAASLLSPPERALWAQMPGPDRRHSVAVARRVAALVPAPSGGVLAAALLHDVGKVESGLGTLARVGATLIGAVCGRSRAARWGNRVGAYLDHPARGAERLHQAGSAPLTVAWAAEHHLPPARWSVPPEVGATLAAADDD